MRTLACIALPCWKADISGENSSPHGNWSMFIQQTIGCWDAYPRQLSHKVTRLQTFVQPWLLLLHTKRLSVAKQTRHLDLMLQARVQLCPKGCWATFHEKKGWRKAEMGNRHLTLQTARWLLAHSSSSAEATGSGFMVLRPTSFGLLVRIPAGPALWSIFFLSHLICWLASKLIKIILSWQAT